MSDTEKVELNEKELEIVDYINDKLLQSETEAKAILKNEVAEKYGDEGKRVWNLLEGDEELDMNIEDCPECGEMTDEWLDDIKKKMEQFDVFLDDTLDDVVTEIISRSDGVDISDKIIYDSIVSVMDGFKDGDDVPTELINKVKQKTLFAGIIDGWLVNEYFKGA